MPELAAYATKNKASLQHGRIDYVDWDTITIGTIACQSAGIFRDFAFVDIQLQKVGLPPVTPMNASFGDNALDQLRIPCNRSGEGSMLNVLINSILTTTAFFADTSVQHSIISPFSPPIYSNSAFQILGYALENINRRSSTDLVERILSNPWT